MQTSYRDINLVMGGKGVFITRITRIFINIHVPPTIFKYSFAGHGPFSHMFDAQFIPAARPESKWTVC
jgi:hypothetical protein